MKLTPLQLEIQKRSDKTLSFGCLVRPLYSNKEEEIQYITWVGTKHLKWCDYIDVVLLTKPCGLHSDNYWLQSDIDTIGHPITRGRLCYLYCTQLNYAIENKKPKIDMMWDFDNMQRYTHDKCHILQKNIIERPEDFQLLVKAFLDTLPKEIWN
mgnify:CR=1 FL=1